MKSGSCTPRQVSRTRTMSGQHDRRSRKTSLQALAASGVAEAGCPLCRKSLGFSPFSLYFSLLFYTLHGPISSHFWVWVDN